MKAKCILAAIVSVMTLASAASATTYYWNGGASGNWSTTTTAWTDGVNTGLAWGTDAADAVFNTSNATVTLAATYPSVNSMTFNASGDAISGGSLTTASGNSLTINSALGVGNTVSSTLTGSGSLVIAGAGMLSVADNLAYSGSTYINSGTLLVKATAVSSAFTNGSTIAIASGANLVLGNTIGSYTISNVISGSGTLTQTSSGETDLTGANTFSGTLVVNGNSSTKIALDNASATGVFGVYMVSGYLSLANAFVGGTATISSLAGTGGVINPIYGGNIGVRTLNVNQSTNTVYAGTMADNGINGRCLSLVKSGSGTLVLTGANTYAGTTTILGGTLQIGGGSTSGTLGSGAVVNNASLVFNRSDSYAVSNIISGSGSLTQAGAGLLTLSGVNTYTGATTVNAGTLALSSSGSLASSALIFGGSSAAAAVFDVSAKAADYSLGTAYGVGTIALASGKTLTLTGAINHVGTDALTISGGLTLADGVSNTYEINLSANTNDITTVAGALNYDNATLTIAFSGKKTTVGVYTFDILDFASESGVATVAYSGLTANESASYNAATGVVTLTVVPEPSTLALLAAALGLIGFAWRRRKG